MICVYENKTCVPSHEFIQVALNLLYEPDTEIVLLQHIDNLQFN